MGQTAVPTTLPQRNRAGGTFSVSTVVEFDRERSAVAWLLVTVTRARACYVDAESHFALVRWPYGVVPGGS